MKKLWCCLMIVLLAAASQAINLPVTDQLIIHLKADSLSLSDGAAVTSWADSATADTVNGTVSTVAGYTTPVFKTNIYNGKPVVRFTDDLLCTASNFTLPNPTGGVTIFALCEGGNSGVATERVGQLGDSAGTGGKVVGLEVSTNKTDTDGGSGFRFNNGKSLVKAANPLTTGFHRICWKHAQGVQHQNAVYRVDGTQRTFDNKVNPTTTTTLQTTGNTFSMGTGKLTGGWITTDYYSGDVAEIIVYNKQLSTTEIQQVEDYLIAQYDNVPPTPNPMTWASVPAATSSSAITMTATTATDPRGVEYYFDETSGNPGGTDSGWQASPAYTDTGLSEATTYSYTVKARDLSGNLNETAVSTVGNATTQDVTSPTPNPMTWSSVPAATSSSEITMTATTVTDPRGVEYYFDETSGNPGGTDSGWQASPTYTDTGLSESTAYSYTVKARDLSSNHNETSISTVGNATTQDATPPTPNPMTWASVPVATGGSQITMTATTATDPSGVEYYFDETSGNPGGTDSGWQASPTYTDTGLSGSTTYSYTVKARDLSANHNETAVSTVGNATTQDVTSPTPNPMTWSSVPAAISGSEIAMTATTATDPSGVEYFFDETSGNPGGTDSGWQASPTYTDTGLSESTTYSYTVKARDLSANHNETAVSAVGNATTITPPPVTNGLIIHLRAESLFLNDNDSVSQWGDSATSDSVNGTVSSVGGSGTPIFVRSAINGLPAVRFVSTELDLLKSGLFTWDQTKGVTVFMVTTGGLSTEQRAMQIGKSGGTVNKSFGCDVSSGVSGVRYNNGYCTATSPFADGEWHISIRQMEQGGGYGGTFYGVDDIPLCRTSTNAATQDIAFDASGNDISLGAGGQNSGWVDYYDGDIAEILVYNEQLSQSEMKQVRSYLNNKYNTYPYTWGEPFTIVAIPDSQGYTEHSNQPASTNLFVNEIAWVRNNINSLNTVLVTHEGDFMTTSNTTKYDRAHDGWSEILNTIPISMVPGNHDYDNTLPSQNATLWNSYFGPYQDYVRDKSWFGGYFSSTLDSSGMSTYQEFSTAEIDFLHLALEVDPDDTVIAWAKGIINAHPGWPTIVTTHSFLSAASGDYKAATSRDPLPRNSGQQIWDELIKVKSQIFMVLCGHSFDQTPAQRRVDNNNAGYPVYQILADYQEIYSGTNLGHGGGWVRVMTVDPVANNVHVRTYSTILNKYSNDASLTDGSTYARLWAPFNYANEGTGSLLGSGNSKSSDFTIPFIYGQQLPMP